MTNTDVCSTKSFPFDFFGVDGSLVDGVMNSDGLCTFPTANCAPNLSVSDCCMAKPELEETGDNYMNLAFAIIFIPYIYLTVFSKTKEEREANAQFKRARTPSWLKAIPNQCIQKLFQGGLTLNIVMQIMVPIYMRQSIQARLDVRNRNTIVAAEAFLVPFADMFKFIEDIILVRVNYALGSGDKELTNSLVHFGYVGALFSGVLAAVVGTVLGAIPRALQALTLPGAANDARRYEGCDIIADSVIGILPYWLIELWAMPGTQLGLVMSGFLMGAMELPTVGWLGAISLAMTPIIWFTFSGSASNKIFVLGCAEFASAWCLPILATLYVVSPLGKDLREHTGVELELGKLGQSVTRMVSGEITESRELIERVEETGMVDNQTQKPRRCGEERSLELGLDQESEPEDSRKLLFDGLKIMFMDVAIQFCISLSIYLALTDDAAEGSKLTALQSALPTYGIAYALGMGIMFKIVGPQLIAAKKYILFARLARITVLCAFLLVPLIFGSVIPYTRPLAFNYGSNACEYAKDDACLPFFANVFGPNGAGGDFTLGFTFNAFAIGASIEAVFFVLRATLLALLDLDNMMRCTIIAVTVYIPAIVMASLVAPFGGHAVSYFVAMFVPQAVLIVLFVIRLEVLLRRMAVGRQGTWTSRSNPSFTGSVSIQSLNVEGLLDEDESTYLLGVGEQEGTATGRFSVVSI